MFLKFDLDIDGFLPFEIQTTRAEYYGIKVGNKNRLSSKFGFDTCSTKPHANSMFNLFGIEVLSSCQTNV